MKPAVFLGEAREETGEAARYYEQRSDGLGEQFLLRVRESVQDVTEHPGACPIVWGPVRRKLVRQFPYGVFYREYDDEILVIAVAHLRRRPGYWTPRVR
jgi:plasmid stabilization system protein ParE